MEDLDGLARAICDCLVHCCEDLPRRVAKEVEKMLLTSRGPTVRPPPTCAQPVRSNDVDDHVLGFDLPAADADGVSRCVVARRARRAMVIKALNWEFAVDKSVQRPSDPGDQLVVDVLVDGQQIGSSAEQVDAGDSATAPSGGKRTTAAYYNQSRPPAPGGVDSLSAAQIYVREGQLVELRARRVTPPTGQARLDFKISVRWKGWEWDPTSDGDGLGGAIAF